MTCRISGVAALALGLALLLPAPLMAQATTMTEDMKAAASAYAEAQKTEVIKQQSKAAITALYKKLYGSGANKQLMRTLGTVALNAEDINKLAENTAAAIYSGNPESVKAAAGQVAIGLGQALTTAISDPQLRQELAGALGGIDKVNEIADVLGKAAGGDKTAALEYAGRALIAATPAAGIFTAAESAAGAMKYAHGKFVNSELEELYRRYAAGDEDTRAAIREELEVSGPYHHIVSARRRELEAEKIDAISQATAEPGERLRKRLTTATEREVVDGILENFAARAVRERQKATALAARKQAEAEASAMLEALGAVVRTGYGKDWANKYSFNYERFLEIVRQSINRDGVLDPHDRVHVTAMSRLLATRMVFGTDSKEYRDELKGFNEYRQVLSGNASAPQVVARPPAEPAIETPAASGDACLPGSRTRKEADRLWAEAKAIKERTKGNAAMLGLMEKSVALCPDPPRVKDRNVWRVVLKVGAGIDKAAPRIPDAVNRVP